jgi:hypothetical protein
MPPWLESQSQCEKSGLVIDRNNPGFEIDGQLACPDRRFRVALRKANDFELGQATAP